MINEVDEALRSLVRAEVVNGADVDVVFDAPTREWASRRNKPAIDLYLYDIREDLRRRQTGMIERRNDQGLVDERQDVPRFYKLAYLITAWTQRPEDEHRLLSALLACFMRHEFMPESLMPPLLADTGMPLGMQIAYPPPEDRQVSDVWSSLGGDLKASVDLVMLLPIRPQTFYEVAQAVMAPLRLHTHSQNTIESDDGERQMNRSASTNGAESGPPEQEEPEPAPQPASGRRTRAPRNPGS